MYNIVKNYPKWATSRTADASSKCPLNASVPSGVNEMKWRSVRAWSQVRPLRGACELIAGKEKVKRLGMGTISLKLRSKENQKRRQCNR